MHFLNCICGYYETTAFSCLQEELNLKFCFLTIILLVASLFYLNKFNYLLNLRALNSDELHAAAFENDSYRCIRIIQRHPGCINQLHPIDGYSPFMRACMNGNTMLIRYMLNHGANVNLRSPRGEGPFYLCVLYFAQNHEASDALCLHTLLEANCDINQTTVKGHSALHLAAMFGLTSICKWLLQNGAVISGNPNPYTLARFQGHILASSLIKQYMRNRLTLPLH